MTTVHHQVLWSDPKMTPLYYEEKRVVDDLRFSMVRPSMPEWNLQIQVLRVEDQGVYTCSVNTVPVKNVSVSLVVAGSCSSILCVKTSTCFVGFMDLFSFSASKESHTFH